MTKHCIQSCNCPENSKGEFFFMFVHFKVTLLSKVQIKYVPVKKKANTYIPYCRLVSAVALIMRISHLQFPQNSSLYGTSISHAPLLCLLIICTVLNQRSAGGVTECQGTGGVNFKKCWFLKYNRAVISYHQAFGGTGSFSIVYFLRYKAMFSSTYQ